MCGGYPRTVSVVDERRCPNCSALVSADADWCGQCFASLRLEPDPTPGPVPGPVPGPLPATGPLRADEPRGGPGEERRATWTCPACEHPNAIELDACEVCGTTFATLFRQEETRPSVDPRRAFTSSLLFPGLGHRALGRGADGVARGVLFLWTFGTAILILFSGVSSGPVAGLFALYLLLRSPSTP